MIKKRLKHLEEYYIGIVSVALMPFPVAHWRPEKASWENNFLSFSTSSEKSTQINNKCNLLASLLPLFLPNSLDPLRLLVLKDLLPSLSPQITKSIQSQSKATVQGSGGVFFYRIAEWGNSPWPAASAPPGWWAGTPPNPHTWAPEYQYSVAHQNWVQCMISARYVWFGYQAMRKD